MALDRCVSAHKLDFTCAYEGVLEALKALHQLHDAPGSARAMAVLTNKPVLKFAMSSNVVLAANFVDVTKPTLSITNVPVSG